MQGRLQPARGGPASSFTVHEVVKVGQAKAHREASVQILQRAVAGLAKRASGEVSGALRSTLASFAGPELAREQAQEVAGTQETSGTAPGASGQLASPARGLGTSWAPGAADVVSIGLHEDQEKQAFLRHVLGAGRRGASALAARGGRTGRVGRFLQRDVRHPLTSVKASPSVPRSGGPYRTPGKVAPAAQTPSPTQQVKPRAAKPGAPVKPKSLTRSLLPGALMIGAGYGAIKGVPAAINWASRAANSPMAYNFGHQQYQYGYTPRGQAQF